MLVIALLADHFCAEKADLKAGLIDGGYFGIGHFREEDVVKSRDGEIPRNGIPQFLCRIDSGKGENVRHGKDGIQRFMGLQQVFGGSVCNEILRGGQTDHVVGIWGDTHPLQRSNIPALTLLFAFQVQRAVQNGDFLVPLADQIIHHVERGGIVVDPHIGRFGGAVKFAALHHRQNREKLVQNMRRLFSMPFGRCLSGCNPRERAGNSPSRK